MERGQEPVHWEQELMGHRTGDAKGQVQGRGVCFKNFISSYHVQVFVGVEGRGPKLLGRDLENQSLVSLVATVLSEKERWGS